VVDQRRHVDEQAPGMLRAGAYVLLFSGVLLALIAGVAGAVVLFAYLNGTFEDLAVFKQVHGF